MQDWRKRANQNADGTFAVASFGKTLFCGDSVRQRESIVGRCFEICILIEGTQMVIIHVIGTVCIVRMVSSGDVYLVICQLLIIGSGSQNFRITVKL